MTSTDTMQAQEISKPAPAPSSPELARFTELTSKLQDLIQSYSQHSPPPELSNGHIDGHSMTTGSMGSMNMYRGTSRLDGKVAIVTGAGRGIGAGVAHELASRGASVVVNYSTSDEAAQKVVDGITAIGGRATKIKANISEVAEIDRLFRETVAYFGGVDIAISNAGMEDFTPTAEITPEQYDKVFGLNTRAQFFVGQAAWRYCRPNGRVVLMSSIAASIMGPADHALYAGSKAAIEGFVRSMAFDYGKKGMTVNAIAPGGVKSDMFTHAAYRYIPGADKSWGAEQIEQAMAGACPLGRCALPVDIARVVRFLVTEDGGWINGQTIRIAGGSAQ